MSRCAQKSLDCQTPPLIWLDRVEDINVQFFYFVRLYKKCQDMHRKPCLPPPAFMWYGCRGGVQFQKKKEKMLFASNWMKCPDLHRRLTFASPPPLSDGWGIHSVMCSLLEIEWNFQICKEKSHFSTLHLIGWRVNNQKDYFARNWMKFPDLHRIELSFQNPPSSWGKGLANMISDQVWKFHTIHAKKIVFRNLPQLPTYPGGVGLSNITFLCKSGHTV